MKKWILRILVVLLGLIIITLIYGSSIGEQSFEVEITIDANQSECWNFLQDPGKWDKWLKDFKEIEMTSAGIPGTAGTSYILTFDDGEHELFMTQELTQIVPNERVQANLSSSVLNGKMDVQLSKNPDGSTTIVNHTVYNGTNAITSLAMMFAHEKMVESQTKKLL
ncbi:MAG: SRPBCC family protein, partial [Flavobacteriales bacterium]